MNRDIQASPTRRRRAEVSAAHLEGNCEMSDRNRIAIRLATPTDRNAIARVRHDVYARELGQWSINEDERLFDVLDDRVVFIVASLGAELSGFISVTPPSAGSYSVEKYFARNELPFALDGRSYEIRILTVIDTHRGGLLAFALMYAALRWVESEGGTRIIAMGRTELVPMYQRAGLEGRGISTTSGKVIYELMDGTPESIRRKAEINPSVLVKLDRYLDWKLDIPLRPAEVAFHGGAFFGAIGEEFDNLQRRHTVINADVLDAWFPPSPRVVESLQDSLDWLIRTSPPTGCEGMVRVIARAREVSAASILPGAGSSDLIFLAFREWLRPESRVLLLDPTYGEYAHVLQHIVGCRVDRFRLHRENHYAVDVDELRKAVTTGYDLVVLVNPNSPTGQSILPDDLKSVLTAAPECTRFWIDETYIDYLDSKGTIEAFAAASGNVVVCKSMSKVYALSGARAAYLCGPPSIIRELRRLSPPWSVSLLSQVAAVRALGELDYYRGRWAETGILRGELQTELESTGFGVVPGVANFLMFHLPDTWPTAQEIVERCRLRGLFLRDARLMGTSLGDRVIRVAVKDRETNRQMLNILRGAVNDNDSTGNC